MTKRISIQRGLRRGEGFEAKEDDRSQ